MFMYVFSDCIYILVGVFLIVFFFYIFIYMFYVFIILFVFFFFSSRRRHTRLTCDWSSDVCSSDLPRGTTELISSTCLNGSLRERGFSENWCGVRRSAACLAMGASQFLLGYPHASRQVRIAVKIARPGR